jgi:hypothetical protein
MDEHFEFVIADFWITAHHIIGTSAVTVTCSIYGCNMTIKPGEYLRRSWIPFPKTLDCYNTGYPTGYWENVCHECESTKRSWQCVEVDDALRKWERLKKLNMIGNA